jgi:hypothetical protein
VVDVRDDGEIADVIKGCHRTGYSTADANRPLVPLLKGVRLC